MSKRETQRIRDAEFQAWMREYGRRRERLFGEESRPTKRPKECRFLAPGWFRLVAGNGGE